MKLTYYGHACFCVEVAGKKLLFDPFISANPLAKAVDISKIEADYILVSHGHFDHIADAADIAKRTGAPVIAMFEVANWLGAQGAPAVLPMNFGGVINLDGLVVKMVVAQHSSSMPDGSYGGNPCGFTVEGAEGGFYYAGDTALVCEMERIFPEDEPLFAVLPIGGVFTMGIEDAIMAAVAVDAKQVIGVHYDTFPPIQIDHNHAVEAFSEEGYQLLLPEIGETIVLGSE